ncbi:NAD-dependent epimerase/dehydratase family protein [Algoriphagus namhaensis]
MNILITGITGLFGSYLAKSFAGLGNIHGLKRPSSTTRLLDQYEFPIHWHEGDLLDIETLFPALQNIDLVIHAAGYVSFDAKDKETLYQTNVQGTANLVNCMLTEKVPRLIYISSVAAIGRSQELDVISETYKWTESPLNTDYAVSKYWAELEAWRGEQEGLQLLVVNPSVLLGRVSDDRSSTQIYSYLHDGRSYYPQGSINYIDVRDAAEITRQLYEKQQWGERFILNKESLPYKTFFEEMGAAFGLQPPGKSISTAKLRWFLRLQRILSALKLTKTILNKQTAMIAQQHVFFSNQKVTELLEFQYRSLKETFDWAR